MKNYEYDDYDDCEEDILYLYQLRHQTNVLGLDIVSKKLKANYERLEKLYNSNIHGSTYIGDFIHYDNEKFEAKFKDLVNESIKIENEKELTIIKNIDLIYQLQKSRKKFCGIGTNKIKRRLNKLMKDDNIAKCIRLLLEIEDCNIQAKKSYGKYSDRYYNKKSNLILELIEIFKNNNFLFGYQISNLKSINHVIFFELPECEQISFHCNLNINGMKKYEKEWDGKINSTLEKLEKFIVSNYNDITINK